MAKQSNSEYLHEHPFGHWLMVEHYKKIGSKFGCALCEKTHATKQCPNKKKEVDMKPSFDYKSLYEEKEEEQYANYGW